ncbi:MAG: ABC transporter permease [Bacilli bacterium]|nr:ABC transporter permease [Bacilli bacterium]
MGKYVLKRLVLMLFTFWVIFTICFFLIRALPVPLISAPGSDGEAIAREFREKMGYNDPLIVQYFNYFVRLFTATDGGNFGYSFQIQWLASPWELLSSRFPPTVLINVYTMIFAVPVGLGLGILMALRKNKPEDHILSVVVMLVISVPSFVYAFLVQYLFGTVWGILPLTMAAVSDPAINGNWFSPIMFVSMLPAVISMSFGTIAGFARYTRAELTEVLTSDFMLLARTKGLTRTQATLRHAFRNSLVPIFPMILGEFISILSGSIIIESIFAVGGVGGLFLESINRRDYDVFLFVGMFYVLIGLVGGLVVDLSYGIVDPRIRMGGKK